MNQLPQVAGTGRLTYPDAVFLASVIKDLASPARLQIINALHNLGSLRLQEIVTVVGGLSQPTISHHVKDLVDAGLVESVRVGRTTRYRLVPVRLSVIARALWPLTSSVPSLPPVVCDRWCEGCKDGHVPMAGAQ